MKTIVAGINCIAIADSTTSLSGLIGLYSIKGSWSYKFATNQGC